MAKKKPTTEGARRAKHRPREADKLAEQVARLEKKLRGLQEASGKKPGEAEGLAENVVASLGKMIPGLESLIEIASQMPEFHERLASIDEEVKRKFREQPLRRASTEIARGVGGRVMGIPPGVRRARSGPDRSARVGRAQSSGRPAARGKYRQPRPPTVHISPQTPEQLPVDVFDEDAQVVILAEASGLKRKEITVSLEPSGLVIAVDAPQRKSVQRVELPCEVVGEPKVSLAKGILKIQLNKVDNHDRH